MALIHCPECGREISDRAETCPGCGYPLGDETGKRKTLLREASEQDRRFLKKAGILLLAAIVLFLAVLTVLART